MSNTFLQCFSSDSLAKKHHLKSRRGWNCVVVVQADGDGSWRDDVLQYVG
jgi:hypothetical protein